MRYLVIAVMLVAFLGINVEAQNPPPTPTLESLQTQIDDINTAIQSLDAAGDIFLTELDRLTTRVPSQETLITRLRYTINRLVLERDDAVAAKLAASAAAEAERKYALAALTAQAAAEVARNRALAAQAAAEAERDMANDAKGAAEAAQMTAEAYSLTCQNDLATCLQGSTE